LLAAGARLVDDTVEARLERELPRTASAPAALVTLSHEPRLSIAELRGALGLTHSGAVRLVDRLEQDGLVRRSRAGGRAVALHLTSRGGRALMRLERARLEACADLLAPLNASERRQLETLLRRMLAAQTRGEDDLNRICRLCSFEACESGGRACPVAKAARAAHQRPRPDSASTRHS
jgi:DNA-binding MarR family transcriptional regulator